MMRGKRLGIWELPSPSQFLDKALATVWDGGAVLRLDPSVPEGLVTALTAPLVDEDFQPRALTAAPGGQPLKQLADVAGCPTDLRELVVCDRLVLIVDGGALVPGDLANWQTFLSRFAQVRKSLDEGTAILFLAPSRVAPETTPPGTSTLPVLSWTNRLRRVDARIWAEINLSLEGAGPLQSLAVDLAVELCGWRFDLVKDLVTQRTEDLLDPRGWLSRNQDLAMAEAASLDDAPFRCPLALFAAREEVEIRARIWRAQLATLFPRIEEQRLRLIEQYRKLLRVDDRQVEYQVKSIEDIELGGIFFQLRTRISRGDADFVEALKRMRNDLAHRQPVDPADFLCVFSGQSSIAS